VRPWTAHSSYEFAKQFIPGEDTVCVSLFEGTPELSTNYLDSIHLKVADILPGRGELDGYKLFNEQHAAELANFLTKHRGRHIFVHCAAGISRSAAVIEVILEAFPEYRDRGHNLSGLPLKFPNVHIKALLKRAMGLIPIGG